MPLQVENGSTIQVSNLTEYSVLAINPTTISQINGTNVSGWFQISYQAKDTIATVTHVQLYKNDVAFGVDHTGNELASTYTTFFDNFSGVINSSDIFQIKGYDENNVKTVYVQNVMLNFSYILAPTILTPINNSAQTSRTVNLTWSGISGNVQYQVSSDSVFTVPYIDGNSSLNYSGNKTFNVGLNYIRARGLNDGVNETNWSTSQILIADNIGQVGDGSIYNWSQNTVFENTTQRKDISRIYWGNYIDGMLDNVNRWNFYGGNFSVHDGALYAFDDGTNNIYTASVNGFNQSNVDLYIKANTLSRPGSAIAGVGGVTRWINSSNYYMWLNYNNTVIDRTYINSSGVRTTLNSSSTVMPDLNTEYSYRMQNYNNTVRVKQPWLIIDTSNSSWNATAQNNSFTNGSIGVSFLRSNVTYSLIWARPVDNTGLLITSGNATTTIDVAAFGDNNTILSGLGFHGLTGVDINHIDIYISTSSNNSVFGSEVLLQANATSDSYYSVNSSNKQRYVKIRANLSGTEINSSWIGYYTIAVENPNKISGYVKYQNGTGIPNATVGYYQNWVLTNSTGYYNFIGMDSGDYVFATGLSGYRPQAELLIFNATNDTIIQNFTLIPSGTILPNSILSSVEQTVNVFIQAYNRTGYYNDSYFPEDQYDLSQGNVEVIWPHMTYSAISRVSGWGINLTPQFFERTVSIFLNQDKQISTRTYRYDFSSQPAYPKNQQSDWIMYSQMSAYDILVPYLSSSVLTRVNTTLQNFNSNDYASVCSVYAVGDCIPSANQVYDDNITMGNWAYEAAVSEQIRVKHGLTSNLSYLNAFTHKHLLQANGTGGFFIRGETVPASFYFTVELNALKELEKYGYYNSSVNQTILQGMNIFRNMTMVDGDILETGRSSASVYSLGFFMALYSIDKTGESYRKLDLGYSKGLQYTGWRDWSYYTTRSYFTPYRLTSGYSGWSKANGVFLMGASLAGIQYDYSIPETNFNYNNMNDLNSFNLSSFYILQTQNYSVWIYPSWYNNSQPFPYQNGTGIMPMYLHVTVREAQNQTISNYIYISEGCSETNSFDCDKGRSLIRFNNKTVKLNTTDINYTQATKSISSNNIMMNWSKVNLSDGTQMKYYEINATVISNDYINVSYKFDGTGRNNFTLPIDFLFDDNRSKGTVVISGSNLTYNRGNETLTLANFSLSGASGLVLSNNNNESGESGYGLTNRTLMTANITGNDVVMTYDLKITTLNKYKFLLNQPPGIMSHLPESPTTSINGFSQQFSVSFSQDNINVTWQVDNITRQNNNSISGGTTVLYTNSTAGIGLHQVNVTGCNAQGCATQLWDWTITGDETISVCKNLNSSVIYTLTQNITGEGDCLVINSSDISINLAGYIISYANSSNGVGINSSASKINLTIYNGTISKVANGSTAGSAIKLAGMNNSVIYDLIISSNNAGSRGIQFVTNGTNNTIRNNQITTGGSNSEAILIPYNVNNNIIHNNTISTSWYGVSVEGNNNSIRNNSISITGVGNAIGTRFDGWSNGNLNNIFENNTIIANNIYSKGISIDRGGNLTITNGSISSTGTTYYILSNVAEFTNTNFTGIQKIYLGSGIYFNYTQNGIGAKTVVSSATTTSRRILNWTNSNMSFLESSTTANVNFSYNITGMQSSKTYTTSIINSTSAQINTVESSANGNLIFSGNISSASTIKISFDPGINTWFNNYTNSSVTSFEFIVGNITKFNVTANQEITSWVWKVDGSVQSNNFDNFTYNFSSIGNKNISVNASNINGTSGTITWTVSIIDAPVGEQVLDNDSSIFWVRSDGNNVCNGQNNMSYANNYTDCAKSTVLAGINAMGTGHTLNVVNLGVNYSVSNLNIPSGNSSNYTNILGINYPVLNTSNGIAIWDGSNHHFIVSGFKAVTGSGQFYYTTGTSYNFEISNNIIESNYARQIWLKGHINNVTIKNNEFYGGMSVNSGSSQGIIEIADIIPRFENITIDGNYIHDTSYLYGSIPAGVIIAANNSIVKNNIVELQRGNSTKCITIGTSSFNVDVINNTVRSCDRAIRSDYLSFGGEIAYNNISDSGGASAIDFYSDRVSTGENPSRYYYWFHDNFFLDAGAGFFTVHHLLFENNTMINSGISLDSSAGAIYSDADPIIRNNTLINSGISLKSTIGNASISQNRFYYLRDIDSNECSFICIGGASFNNGINITSNDFYDSGIYSAIKKKDATALNVPVVIKNNIFHTVVSALDGSTASGLTNVNISYNLVYQNSGTIFGGKSHSYTITSDPLFYDPLNNDTHLKSQNGRWYQGGWVQDTVDSPAIDSGDPLDSWSNEVSPNGSRINMGSYGNTEEASLSCCISVIKGNLTGITYYGGSPLSGVLISIIGLTNTSNASGEYYISNISIGNWTVTASKNGYVTNTSYANITENNTIAKDFTLTLDVTPPVISNVQISNIHMTNATISWNTDVIADSRVMYGTTQSYGLNSTLDETNTQSHSVILTGLNNTTLYYFKAISNDTGDLQTVSSEYNFTTLSYETINITVLNDTSIRSLSPDLVRSSNSWLDVGYLDNMSYGTYRTLIKFNIPSNVGTILNSSLVLFYEGTNRNQTTNISLYRLAQAWDNNATWNNRTNNSAWTTGGGSWYDSEGTLNGNVSYQTINYTIGNTSNLVFNSVKTQNIINGMINGSITNNGFLFKSDETDYDYLSVYSAESIYPPTIIINYYNANLTTNYIPPSPINIQNTSGNFWINHSWQAGTGNKTDSYNISQNGNWTNGTVLNYSNNSISANGWSNISVYAWNNSGTGTLNLTAISMNTQLANNPVTLNPIANQTVTAGQFLNITWNANDIDLNYVDFDRNFTQGNFSYTPDIDKNGRINIVDLTEITTGTHWLTTNNGTPYPRWDVDHSGKTDNADYNIDELIWLQYRAGALVWNTNQADVGTYTFYLNATDGFGSVSSQTINVTVNAIPEPSNATEQVIWWEND